MLMHGTSPFRHVVLFFAVLFFALLTIGISYPHATSSAQQLLRYEFKVDGVLQEAASAPLSSSPSWWLLSGGSLIIENGVGRTIHGKLSTENAIRKRYALDQPVSSDNGYHPQNIFKLLTKETPRDFRQEITVTVKDLNLLNSQNVNPWNAVSLISRYQNGTAFYYGSLRMDGKAVIKKKAGGAHYDLASAKPIDGTYEALGRPNLLPLNQTMRLALETMTNDDGSVALRMYRDETNSGAWKLIAEARDDGISKGPVISAGGHAGFFSDYMDLVFDDYGIDVVASVAPVPSSPTYGLAQDTTVTEAGTMDESPDDSWWVNSGAYFFVKNSIGSTIQGSLGIDDPWRKRYASANPTDTDGGLRPQNIFRLVTKSIWQNAAQEGYFWINRYNASASPNRAEHNGFLFFNRYRDGNNLYYTGIRVDGRVVIKKKLAGRYYTLSSAPVYNGTYHRDLNPNLIPTGVWIGLKTVVRDNTDGSVTIEVYVDKAGNGSWSLAARALDNGTTWGSPIRGGAHAGIRTDFMDVDVSRHTIKEL